MGPGAVRAASVPHGERRCSRSLASADSTPVGTAFAAPSTTLAAFGSSSLPFTKGRPDLSRFCRDASTTSTGSTPAVASCAARGRRLMPLVRAPTYSTERVPPYSAFHVAVDREDHATPFTDSLALPAHPFARLRPSARVSVRLDSFRLATLLSARDEMLGCRCLLPAPLLLEHPRLVGSHSRHRSHGNASNVGKTGISRCRPSLRRTALLSAAGVFFPQPASRSNL